MHNLNSACWCSLIYHRDKLTLTEYQILWTTATICAAVSFGSYLGLEVWALSCLFRFRCGAAGLADKNLTTSLRSSYSLRSALPINNKYNHEVWCYCYSLHLLLYLFLDNQLSSIWSSKLVWSDSISWQIAEKILEFFALAFIKLIVCSQAYNFFFNSGPIGFEAKAFRCKHNTSIQCTDKPMFDFINY
jgi:hypothetical protein